MIIAENQKENKLNTLYLCFHFENKEKKNSREHKLVLFYQVFIYTYKTNKSLFESIINIKKIILIDYLELITLFTRENYLHYCIIRLLYILYHQMFVIHYFLK